MSNLGTIAALLRGYSRGRANIENKRRESERLAQAKKDQERKDLLFRQSQADRAMRLKELERLKNERDSLVPLKNLKRQTEMARYEKENYNLNPTETVGQTAPKIPENIAKYQAIINSAMGVPASVQVGDSLGGAVGSSPSPVNMERSLRDIPLSKEIALKRQEAARLQRLNDQKKLIDYRNQSRNKYNPTRDRRVGNGRTSGSQNVGFSRPFNLPAGYNLDNQKLVDYKTGIPEPKPQVLGSVQLKNGKFRIPGYSDFNYDKYLKLDDNMAKSVYKTLSANGVDPKMLQLWEMARMRASAKRKDIQKAKIKSAQLKYDMNRDKYIQNRIDNDESGASEDQIRSSAEGEFEQKYGLRPELDKKRRTIGIGSMPVKNSPQSIQYPETKKRITQEALRNIANVKNEALYKDPKRIPEYIQIGTKDQKLSAQEYLSLSKVEQMKMEDQLFIPTAWKKLAESGATELPKPQAKTKKPWHMIIKQSEPVKQGYNLPNIFEINQP